MRIIEPLLMDKKLSAYLDENTPKSVLIFFWHGLGDLIMFLEPFRKLKELYPEIKFDLALAKGLGQEEIYREALLVEGDETKDFSSDRFKEYDLVVRINFPMNEGQIEFTKGEWCCIHELGIEPVWGHTPIESKSRLVACHFQITCLPDSANVPYEVAKKVWFEIKEAGYVPIETLMKHVFHNPVNEKYDFIDRHLRDIEPSITTLAGVLGSCRAFVGGVSGNFHLALSVLPNENICLLEKDFFAPSFTKLPIKRVNVTNYVSGAVKDWLGGLSDILK